MKKKPDIGKEFLKWLKTHEDARLEDAYYDSWMTCQKYSEHGKAWAQDITTRQQYFKSCANTDDVSASILTMISFLRELLDKEQ